MAASALALAAALIAATAGMFDAAPAADPAWGTYAWPVVGPVTRGFEPPPDPYGPGHRGIDIAADVGTPIVAAQDGVVAFAGWVAGALYISIDHPDGVRTTYSWVSSAAVSAGASVVRGQPIGTTGTGHPGVSPPHLHFGALQGDTYLDPMVLLEHGTVAGLIHLAPLSGSGPFAHPTGRSPPRRSLE
jgi:murein DD-endopeptidase MepM/ murein hydrolase activator NlpD